MIKSRLNLLDKVKFFFSKNYVKKFNKKIINYEKICIFGVNPDSLINDSTST